MRNKKILLSLIALNTLTTPISGATPKYEKLYDKIVKNLEAGKSNSESYKLINQILVKRNKELKDLYSQNDYTVKPEYIEWQIFYNGFYNYTNKGGKKSHSGNVNFEPIEKTLNLGVIIPIKGKVVPEVNYNISLPKEYTTNLNISEVNREVAEVSDYDFESVEFPKNPVVDLGIPMSFYYTHTDEVGISTQAVQFNTSGDATYENLNVTSLTKTKFELNENSTPNDLKVTGQMEYNNGSVTGTTPTSYTHGSINPKYSIINIGTNGDFNIRGDWEFYTNHKTGNSLVTSFLSYRPIYVTTDSKVIFHDNLELTATGTSSKPKIGLSLDIRNTTAAANTKVTLENKGKITISDQNGIAMQVLPYGETGTIEGELINSGTIELNSANGTYLQHATGIAIGFVQRVNTGKAYVKSGNINVNGYSNTGVSVYNMYSEIYEDSRKSNVILDGSNGVITVNGTKNTGVFIGKGMGPQGTVTNLENVRNLDILVDGYISTGFKTDGAMRINTPVILSDSVINKIEFGNNATYGSLIYADQGRRGMIIDESMKNSIGIVNKGTRNIVLLVGTNSLLINRMPIEIGEGARGTYAVSSLLTTPHSYYYMGEIENYADIINNSAVYKVGNTAYGALSLGSFSYGATIKNEGNIDMNGENAVGIYVKGKAESVNDHISINNNKGVAVFGNYGSVGVAPEYIASETVIKSNKLEVNGDQGVVIYSNGGNIELSPNTNDSLEIIANGKDTYAFFYEIPVKTSIPTKGKITITDTVNVNLKNGAIGFYYNGNAGTADISTYLNNMIDTSNGNLNIKSDENSYNIFVENSILNLSDISNLDTDNIKFSPNGKMKVYKSDLFIDMDTDLDKNNAIGDKTYSKMSLGLSNITVNNGVTISGTEEGQVGLVQSTKYNEPLKSSINNGLIDLKGSDSKGMYTKRSYAVNNGVIRTQGEKGIGLYTKGGNIENTGNIYIGDSGIGMYSTTYIEPADNPVVNSVVSKILNTGKIESLAGTNAIGIFGNKNTAYGLSNVTLSENSDIDVSKSVGGIGVYVNKASLNNNSYSGAGKITVGENGIGLYVKDSDVLLNDLELNLFGDNSIGIYADGNTNFTGTGDVNIDGKGIIVFNVNGNTNLNQNFNISSTAGSNYILQNLSNAGLYYNSTAVLDSGGVFLAGTNSAVLLGEDSNLTSTESNVVGVALNGSYPLPDYINGIYVEHEITNLGRISFGDDSIGLYTVNGANSINKNEITLGANSVALYGKGTNTIINNVGEVRVGKSSVGMYLENGEEIYNSGSVRGTEDDAVGLLLNENSKLVYNSGIIDLSGENTVGIYTKGKEQQKIYNSGTIKVGNSNTSSELSIGIYNDNSNGSVYNTGDIISGSESIGIYNIGGEINHENGKIDVGLNGLGIYSDSGSVNLNNGELKLNGTNSIGIYGKNNALIENNLKLDVTDDSYGIILNTGSELINRNILTAGENSVLVYSNGKGTILNETNADLIMERSNSIGFYMENGETITNKAVITGNTGTANIGIYNKYGNVYNSGDIKLGDSLIIDPKNSHMNFYSVGIYGENVENLDNSGNLEIGKDAIGLYGYKNIKGVNTGNIYSTKEGALGIYLVNGVMENHGDITLSGGDSIGIVGTLNSTIRNHGKITMNGNSSIGIYGQINSKIINEKTGKIYINGNDSAGVQLSENSILENYGEIKISEGTVNSKNIVDNTIKKELPSIINAGIIKVDEKFEIDGFNLIIKGDPDSFRTPTLDEVIMGNYDLEALNGGFLLTNSVKVTAPSFDFGNNSVGIDPLFTQGTNARVYKFENVFDPLTPEGGINEGELKLKSGSLTFDAIPVFNKQGKVDIWMEKIDYDKFTEGSWYDGFAKNIEEKYLNAKGDALKIYDKLDLITDVESLGKALEDLSGGFYANINQRESDIIKNYKNNLNILQESENKTKENVKLSVIAGGGRTKETTNGIETYDYKTYGVAALREVERTYKHKYAYSGGYTKTSFDVGDNNKDSADTFYLGLHNKFKTNDWVIKNDLIGSMSLHDTERKVNFLEGKKLKSDYNVYGISLSNKIEKETELAKNIKLVPTLGLELGYMGHNSFKEKGETGNLDVKKNDVYIVNPSVGIRLEGEKEFGDNKDLLLKSSIGLSYGYEFGNINKEEKVSLKIMEKGYHKLAKSEDEKGKTSINGEIIIEKGNYGVYVTGEYSIRDNKKEDSKVGVGLKISF